MKEALIDTDILSYFLQNREQVVAKVEAYLKIYRQLNISIITQYEILSGLEYKQAHRQIESFKRFSDKCNVVNLSDESVAISARIYSNLRRKGITISSQDILIAGVAVKNNWSLVTNNTRHYQAIEGLVLDNWNA